MAYKELVQQIADLPWSKARPEDIIYLSRATAIEFAESLRKGLELYPEDVRLKLMAEGELSTDNMRYGSYDKRGDHWQFLDHFIKELALQPSGDHIEEAARRYTEAIRALLSADRAMSVFSREEELTLIFHKIIAAHDWDGLGYGFYKYYLESHIEFDSGDGGHKHLTAHFPLHEDLLERFYLIRLNLYSALFTGNIL